MRRAKHRIVLAAKWEQWRRGLEDEHRQLGMEPAEAKAEADRAWARMKARLAWVDEQLEAMQRLHDALGEYWGRYADEHPEIDFEDPDCPQPPQPPEQAALERIEEAIAAVRERDQWPPHLYFGDV